MTKLPQILIIDEPNDNNKHCLNGKTKENFPGWDLNLDSLVSIDDQHATTVVTEDYAKVRYYDAYCFLL